MDKEDVVYIYKGILCSHKKEQKNFLKDQIWVSSNEVDEPRTCYTEWSKSEGEKQIPYINASIWNLEIWYWWTYFSDRGFPGGSEVKASAWNTGDPGSIPGSGRSPGEGNGTPLQYSCLENPMEGGARETTVHGVAKSQTWLSDFIFTFHGI